MSTKNTITSIQSSYLRNNQIRTKLLLFIDNEIQSKIKQNNHNLKFICEDEIRIKISFEETFTQKRRNKYVLYSSIITKNRKNINSDKSSSTIDGSSNKNIKKRNQTKRINTYSKICNKKNNHSNEILNNYIYFNEKIYLVKKISRQSSTFLILPKHQNGTEHLKILFNNLKIAKNNKKPIKKIRSIKSISNTKSKLFDLNKDKITPKKSNEIITQKSKKENHYTHSLFRKSHKDNFVINSKYLTSGK